MKEKLSGLIEKINSIKINKDILIFVIMFAITCVIFAQYLTAHFSIDTYGIYNSGLTKYAVNHSLSDARIIMFVITYFADIVNLSIDNYIIILTVLAIIVSCITVIILKNIILKYKKTENKLIELAVIVISYYTIFNFMYIENMYFVECFVMSLSLLFYLLAAKVIVDKEDKYIRKTIILLILGTFSYQGTISMFFIALLTFSLIEKEDVKILPTIKRLVINLFSGAVILIGVVVLNVIFLKLPSELFGIKESRTIELDIVLKNIILIFLNIKNISKVIINTANIFSEYTYILFVFFIESIVVIKAIIQGNKKIVVATILIVIASVVFSLMTSVVNTSGFWAGRTRFSIGACVGFLFIYLYIKTDLLEQFKITNILLGLIFVVYAIMCTSTYINVIETNKIVNELDKQKAIEIAEYIERYETENNINVKYACAIKKSNKTPYYDNVDYKYSIIATSAMKTIWAMTGVMNYYTNANLTEYLSTENVIESMDNENEYVCIGDTIYISTYMN